MQQTRACTLEFAAFVYPILALFPPLQPDCQALVIFFLFSSDLIEVYEIMEE